MAHKRVVRTRISTMKAVEEEAHLVAPAGMLRAFPSFCGRRVQADEFWEKAPKKTPLCKNCKAHVSKR